MTDNLETYTLEEVKKHKHNDDCWIIINKQIYNVTDFLSEHPGGKKTILSYAGRDATKPFESLHRPEILDKYGKTFQIGFLQEVSKL